MFDIFENIRKVNDLSSDVTTKLDILVNNIFPQLDRKNIIILIHSIPKVFKMNSKIVI